MFGGYILPVTGGGGPLPGRWAIDDAHAVYNATVTGGDAGRAGDPVGGGGRGGGDDGGVHAVRVGVGHEDGDDVVGLGRDGRDAGRS